ncbi:MAG TPA: ATP-dependent helicase, partial [Desulfomonilia bacterium]|nr:ATP-dependent helicase [Desulfomonilia bacterium]
HNLWGAKINTPFSLALQAAWEEKYHYHLEVIENNDCLLLMLPHEFSAEDIFSLVTPENLERLLRRTLEKSGFFGAKFRENAGRALLLPRADFKKRLPLWLNRLRSKKLMDAVMQYEDFPILLETWRTCLQDEFDLESLRKLLDEVRTGQIRLTGVTTEAASPFADGLVWKQTNTYMYEDDSPLAGKTSGLSRDLLKEVLFSTSLRPRIPGNLIENLEAKLQRTAPGYAPRSAEDLLDWVKERCLIPVPEWQTLLAAMERDHDLQPAEVVEPIRHKVCSIRLPHASVRMVCALEDLDRVGMAFSTLPHGPQEPIEIDSRDLITEEPLGRESPAAGESAAGDNGMGDQNDRVLSEVFLQWLSFYGPLGKMTVSEALGLGDQALDDLLAGLAEAEALIIDLLSQDAAEPEICEKENLEILLRMARKSRQPSFRALGIDHLPLFLAAWQGIIRPGDAIGDLQERMDQLFGYPAPADAWEKQILPARMSPYYCSWLDSLMQTSDLMWFGCGNKKIGLAFADDLELFLERGDGHGGADLPEELSKLFPREIGRYDLLDIVRFSRSDSRTVTKKLWDLVWQGQVSNDSFAALRLGILTNFIPAGLKTEQRRPFRTGYNRWSTARPYPGNWYALDIEGMEKDSIDEVELVKDRVRQLFRRYGILFREILAYELPVLQWPSVFKALRLMELSGEILTGYFFDGIPGVQFISFDAFRFLNDPLPGEEVYWVNAVDPASLCGIRLDSLKGKLPSRIPSTHLVYRGKRPVLISRRNGSVLNFLIPHDDPLILSCLTLFKAQFGREFSPEKIITVTTINGKPALESDYAGPLRDFGFIGEYKGLELEKRYS